ncbi:cysteine rich repeat-containing protein [Allorhizobium borbori]|uniref:Cysteine rich repeat-containing protein n=1 Tax=Allorhizobium borbori TaxID=485907 RepID=A0A7W6K5L0_9HYPH|nr:cysteine rich repeat-containing protein [Allorhizobium borbori]MBB4104447.1 hypothetical protein [Allorhizobium borbori]
MRLLIVTTFTLLATMAHAQQLSRQQLMEIRTVCEADLRKLCAGVQPGGGRLAQCLQQNASSISQPCKEKLAAVRAARS